MKPRTCLLCILTLLIVYAFSGSFVTAQAVSDSTISAGQKAETDRKVADLPLTEVLQETRPAISWDVTFGKVIWSIILFIVMMMLFKYLTLILESIAERWTNLRLLVKRAIPIIRILGWTAVLYVIIFTIIAPPIETLFAVTASAGIAVGFASQDILKNIFGGVMILFDRPFQVGDKILIGTHYGEVIQIGLRSVRVVTPDDSVVSIPNSDIVNQSVSNANTGEFYCQVVAEFYLPPDIDLIKLKKITQRAAAVSQYVYLKKPIAVILKNEINQGRSLLKMRLKAYVFDLRYEFPFMSEMTEIVMSELLNQKLLTAEDLAFVKRSA